jgi:hypothetical protein
MIFKEIFDYKGLKDLMTKPIERLFLGIFMKILKKQVFLRYNAAKKSMTFATGLVEIAFVVHNNDAKIFSHRLG